MSYKVSCLERKEREKRTNRSVILQIKRIMEVLNDVKVSFNFNLRNPRRNESPTHIYCVVKIGQKQIKLPTGCKVWAYQWDKKRQECLITSNMVDAERRQNFDTNNIIYDLKRKFYGIIDYICSCNLGQPETEVYIKRNLIITKDDMANKNAIPPKRTITATKLLQQAFDKYYRTNGNQKESTIATQEARLKKFFDYLTESGKGDSLARLTQDGINEYKEWLISKADENEKRKLGARQINQLCQLIVRLINDVLCVHSDYRRYNMQMVRYVNIEDTRRKDDKYKRALTDEEVDTFVKYIPQNENEELIKDLFILQLNTGVRKGDLLRLANGEYSKDDNGYIIIDTEKEGITAVVEHKHITEFANKHHNGVNVKTVNTAYNNTLKDIFRKCGLTTLEKYKTNVGGRNVEQEKPLCELISSHFARHTFITNKLRDGMSPDKLCYMTGHADDRMIQEVYEHLTNSDKINAVRKEAERITGKKTAEPMVNKGDDLTKSYDSIKAKLYDKIVLKALEESRPQKKKIDILELEVEREQEEIEQEAIQKYGAAAVYGDDDA